MNMRLRVWDYESQTNSFLGPIVEAQSDDDAVAATREQMPRMPASFLIDREIDGVWYSHLYRG